MKKVLFVINTLGIAGAERTLTALLNEFDREKYEVYIRSIIPRGECFLGIPKGVKILNKNYSAKSVLSPSGSFFIGCMVVKSLFINLFSLKNLKAIWSYTIKQIKNERRSLSKIFWLSLALATKRDNTDYDLAVAFLEGASTYYVSERVKAKRQVTFLHNDYKKSGYLKEIDRYYYGKFERIYCVSTSTKEVACEEFPEFVHKIERFQNVVSDELVKSLAKKGKGFTDSFDGIRFVTVGRLHQQKGYDLVVKAFARALIRRQDIKAKWYAIGEGPERNSLLALIKSLGISDNVVLLGKKTNIYPYVDQCDIYVHCTKYEGWSIAIAEAKILAKPMIVSDTTNADKQLPPGTFVVVKRTVEDISNAMVDLMTNEELRKKITEKSSEKWERPNDIPKLYAFLED